MDELREPFAGRALIGDRAVPERPLPVERTHGRQALGDHFLDAIELERLGLGASGSTRDARARLVHVLHARTGDILRIEPLGLERIRTRLRDAGLHVGRIETQHQVARLDGIALAHRDLDDRLLGLGDELDAVALERAEERAALVAVTGRERKRKTRD